MIAAVMTPEISIWSSDCENAAVVSAGLKVPPMVMTPIVFCQEMRGNVAK